ncbi:hypothetical protein BDV06DRAFT_222083 [Aspergillus oleicola]
MPPQTAEAIQGPTRPAKVAESYGPPELYQSSLSALLPPPTLIKTAGGCLSQLEDNRVSPNHLTFYDPEAITDICGVLAISQGVAKDGFYDRAAGDAHDLVQLLDRSEHSKRRKALSNVFAAKTVVNMEEAITGTFLRSWSGLMLR